MPVKIIAAALFILLPAARSQPPRSFEVASVKISQLGKVGGEKGARDSLEISPGGVSMHNFTLLALLEWAYSVKDFQIAAPAWLSSERYEVAAKTAGPASNEQLRAMLRNLLAERFKLELHRETKPTRVLGLIAGKMEPKLQQAKREGTCSQTMEGGRIVFQSCSLSNFADYLGHLPSSDHSVVDMTAISGTYDFSVRFAEIPSGDRVEAKQAAEQAFQDPSLGNLIVEQLGLRLEARRTMAEILVIDHAEKTPIEN